jgi:hypothetical protein
VTNGNIFRESSLQPVIFDAMIGSFGNTNYWLWAGIANVLLHGCLWKVVDLVIINAIFQWHRLCVFVLDREIGIMYYWYYQFSGCDQRCTSLDCVKSVKLVSFEYCSNND